MISVSQSDANTEKWQLFLTQIFPEKSEVIKQPLKILLVDDSLMDQIIAGEMLRKLGHEVAVAGNGAEAIQAIEHKYYDLLIMDVHMPEMDGLQAARHIRNRYGELIRIIFATGSPPDIYREMCFDAGGDDFMTKPLTIARLRAAIDLAMRR
ncbi:MAG: response regulator [Methanothrix sp.]|nr:response regulator [Methanothrix sp.]